MFFKNFHFTERKNEWFYLVFCFLLFSSSHICIMNNINAYSFIIVFILMTFFSIGIFAVRPIIFGTGALSYTAILFWLFSFRGYDMREAHEIALPYLLCWAGVTIGIIITATRSHAIKMGVFRIVFETVFFTISLGLWPFYPRLFATLNNTNIK